MSRVYECIVEFEFCRTIYCLQTKDFAYTAHILYSSIVVYLAGQELKNKRKEIILKSLFLRKFDDYL
jgi:hypothetical protein